MPFGVIEAGIIILIILAVAFLGRKTMKEFYRTFLGAKKDYQDVKQEFSTKK